MEMEGLPKRLERVSQALSLLCTETPPMELVREWCRGDSDELQDWAAQHARLDWFMGITAIDAAVALADDPDENVIARVEIEQESRGNKLPRWWWKD